MSARIVVPDPALLGQAVEKFMGSTVGAAYADAPNTLVFVAVEGGPASQGPTVNY